MAHNEDTRVKIPAILHLTRLGFEYLSLKENNWDIETNIFTDIFENSIKKINNNLATTELFNLQKKISNVLSNDDLGKEFYQMLMSTDIKLIDFNNPEKNSFHVVTELTYKNGEDEFRPDITLLVNGMPLVFIEVKKPNNKDGILAERSRINIRFQNKKFRKFINISQILLFSNNMNYDPDSMDQLQGAYYSSSSKTEAKFNSFHEETPLIDSLGVVDPEVESFILKDNNKEVLTNSKEYPVNKEPTTPTNSILTSLCHKDRLLFLLKYGIAYVKGKDSIQKHIMRYPQYFATKAIEDNLTKGVKKGIVWHTQGSGKTALAFYNTKYLTDYFQKQKTVTKFYFIVDRLDLLDQAKKEFLRRGLVVHTVNSKDALVKDFKTDKATHNPSGSPEITVVNIQKFKEDTSIFEEKKYSTNIQRIYFLDEVHRSYDPKGSFLANLITSDREAIMIGLTGTPLLGEEKNSKNIFGDYFHKYYYNQSIADGYTLKLLREEIATQYKMELNKTLEDIEIEKGKIDTNLIYSDERFVEPMLRYIIEDFKNTRIMHNDKTIGSMVICHSSDQAKMFNKIFNEKYKDIFKASLILHDIGDKDTRKTEVEEFKEGSIDILFVYNMLLTGFDADRLKKLYIGRVVRKHNLLQALTRVNRPYKNFRYGYVVDFADIKKEFDKTNKAYFEELQLELGDELDKYSEIFLSPEKVILQIKEIEDTLFSFDTKNAEIFSQQVSLIEDADEMLLIKNALSNAKDLYNTIRLMGYTELIQKLDFKTLSILYKEAENHLNLVNLKKAISDESNTNNLLNLALEDIVFTFEKKSEEEMKIADEGYSLLASTRAEFNNNFDKSDFEYGKLYEELRRLFESKNFGEISQTELVKNIQSLEKIFKAIKDLNRRNALLNKKYNNDKKFAIIHKKMMNQKDFSDLREITIFNILSEIKEAIDLKILDNKKAISNEGFFTRLISPMIINSFLNQKVDLDNQAATLINTIIAEQYLYDFNTI